MVPKYLHMQMEEKNIGKSNRKDKETDIVLFYFCKCHVFRDKKCKCKFKTLEREPFETMLKRRKKQGMKRKAQWIKQRNKNLKHRVPKSPEKKKVKEQKETMDMSLDTMQMNRCLSKESKHSLISPLSIT